MPQNLEHRRLSETPEGKWNWKQRRDRKPKPPWLTPARRMMPNPSSMDRTRSVFNSLGPSRPGHDLNRDRLVLCAGHP
jgi:hypothetical protein